jgi:hypothetical protein
VTGDAELRAQRAVAELEHNRALLRAAWAPDTRPADQFPRSATLRWASAHLRPRALLSAAAAAALARLPLSRVVMSLLGGLGR